MLLFDGELHGSIHSCSFSRRNAVLKQTTRSTCPGPVACIVHADCGPRASATVVTGLVHEHGVKPFHRDIAHRHVTPPLRQATLWATAGPYSLHPSLRSWLTFRVLLTFGLFVSTLTQRQGRATGQPVGVAHPPALRRSRAQRALATWP